MIDKERAEKAIREMLYAIGEDPDREGLKETPRRVAKAMEEVFEGLNYTNAEIAKKFTKMFEHHDDSLVLVKHIAAYSVCEHHILPMKLDISIAVIPENNKILGLSKFNRVAQMVARRPQLQEKIGTDIAEVFQLMGFQHIAVIIKGEHMCVSMRGAKDSSSITETSTLRGGFRTNPDLRAELLRMLQN